VAAQCAAKGRRHASPSLRAPRPPRFISSAPSPPPRPGVSANTVLLDSRARPVAGTADHCWVRARYEGCGRREQSCCT